MGVCVCVFLWKIISSNFYSCKKIRLLLAFVSTDPQITLCKLSQMRTPPSIRYDKRCHFNMRSKADMSQLSTTQNRQLKSVKTEKLKSKRQNMLRSKCEQSVKSIHLSKAEHGLYKHIMPFNSVKVLTMQRSHQETKPKREKL